MNEDKVIEVFRAIEAEQAKPRRGIGFDMTVWASQVVTRSDIPSMCNTVACFAGHTLINEGYDVDFKYAMFYHPDTTECVDADEAACEVLGLAEDQAEDVFYLPDLDAVYRWFANHMGIDVQVLRDKVTG